MPPFTKFFPPSFQDSNGDGIGDLAGILSRLDYIQDLGFDTIWLSPIFESPFRDAGYDVADYCKIAPRYGTMEHLERLVAGLHQRGMKLLLDFVPGHTSTEHPWFKESCKAGHNAYSDRYIWTDHIFTSGPDNPSMVFINGYAERDGNYLTNYFYFQPALNYGFADPDPNHPWQMATDHPSVLENRAEMDEILRFWLDKGVDGFRVDMANSLIKANDGERLQAKLVELWQGVRSWWDRDYPQAVLISEWSNPSDSIATGFHLDFMIHFGWATYLTLFRGENKHSAKPDDGVSYFNPEGQGDLKTFFQELQGHLKNIGNRGFVSVPSGNHDIPRYSIDRSPEELKVILSFILTLPCVPTIYYGDEIGMHLLKALPSKEGAYHRTAARSPMQWNPTDGAGFSSAAQQDYYLPLSEDPNRANVADQLEKEDSLLNHLKDLLALRKSHPALGSQGAITQLSSPDQPYPIVYLRESNNAAAMVAINTLKEPVTVEFSLAGQLATSPLLGNATVNHQDGKCILELPPLSTFISEVLPT